MPLTSTSGRCAAAVGIARRLIVALATLLVVACGGPRTTTITEESPGSSGPTVNDLRKIVDRRAEAIRRHDQRAYLADLEPSNKGLVARESMVFANLAQFEFSDLHFVLDRALPRRGGGGNAAGFAPVVEVAQLAATDAGPPGIAPGESFEYDLARRDDRWVVADVVPLTRATAQRRQIGLTGPFANAPWEQHPLKVTRASNVWLVGDDTVTDLPRYASAARSAVGLVEGVWGPRPRFPGYVLFLTNSAEHLHAWYELGPAVDRFEGVEIPFQGVRTNGELYSGAYVGARIVVNLSKVAVDFGGDPALVMRHELTHAVTARGTLVASGGGLTQAPIWAVEGFARYVERLEDPAPLAAVGAQAVRQGKFDGQLPSSDAFYDGDEDALAVHYDLGALVFRWVAQTRGQSAAVELFSRVVQYADVKGGPLVGTPAFDGICREVLGLSTADFLAQWGRYVRGLS